MASIKKINPATGKKESVLTTGTIERMGGNASEQFSGKYNYIPKEPVKSPYQEKKKKEVSTLSTEKGKSYINEGLKDQQKDESGLNVSTNNSSNTSSTKNPNQTQYSYEDLQSIGADMNSYSYDPKSGAFTDKPESTDLSASFNNQQNKQYLKDLKEIDKAFKSQQDQYDSAQRAVYESINGIYSQLAAEQKDANERSYASYQNFGVGGGGSRYAGEVTQGILNAETRAGLGRLQDIAAKQAVALADAKSAAATRSWEIFTQKRKEIDVLKKKRQEEIETLRDEGQKRLEAARAAKEQASRDGAVASLITQGVTDPAEILNYLNYDESGKMIGDFTAEEVSKTFENIAGKSGYKSAEKLSADLRDYYILKDMGELPPSISSLPENQQLSAFINTFKGSKSSDGGGSSNKITLTEADKLGLPRSIVGMSEYDILQSFGSETPPSWFVQKAQSEMNQNLLPEKVNSLWNEYRNTFLNATESESTSSTSKSSSGKREI